MEVFLGNNQYHVFIWIACAVLNLLMHSKLIYLFGILNQTLDKQVNPELRFIASYVNLWSPALKMSLSNIYAAISNLNKEFYVHMKAAIFRAVFMQHLMHIKVEYTVGVLRHSLKLE